MITARLTTTSKLNSYSFTGPPRRFQNENEIKDHINYLVKKYGFCEYTYQIKGEKK